MVEGFRLYVDFNGELLDSESMFQFLHQPFSYLKLENIEMSKDELLFEVWMDREQTGK